MNTNFDYRIISAEEMQLLKVLLIENEEGYEGFSLFHENTSILTSYYHEYLVAFDGNKMIGILKFSQTIYGNNVWSVTWIDIHKDYRRQGIARSLYEFLNQRVKKDMILIGTGETPEGKKAKVQELRCSIITNCQVFKDLADMSYSTMKKNA